MKIKTNILKKWCDEIWREVIFSKDLHKCVICGATERLNAHHLITRQISLYRHDPLNGVTLCPKHHTFSPYCSAHKAPYTFFEKLKIARPFKYQYHVINQKGIEERVANHKQTYHNSLLIYTSLEELYMQAFSVPYNEKRYEQAKREFAIEHKKVLKKLQKDKGKSKID